MKDGIDRPAHLRSLRLNRVERFYNLEDIGKVIGMTGQSYGLIERGERRLCVDDALKIAEFYGISLDELLCRKSERREYRVR